jgi:hypothetical protein
LETDTGFGHEVPAKAYSLSHEPKETGDSLRISLPSIIPVRQILLPGGDDVMASIWASLSVAWAILRRRRPKPESCFQILEIKDI